jgi:hypothetical protein
MRIKIGRGAALVCVASLAAGCTSGNSAIEPAFQSTNISKLGVLQFAMGTANIAQQDGSAALVGINTVVTFRKANGGSAFAVDSPQIVGPAGFLVPATTGDAGTDAGTNTINYTAQPTDNSGDSVATTFGTSGSATLYGFGPNNYDTSGSANFGNYSLPMYSDILSGGTYEPQAFDGLPPAFPAPPPGTGFPGYNLGFVDFAAKAVSGSYSLNVLIPTSAGSSQAPYTYHAAATLVASHVLPTLPPPVLAPDATGTGGPLSVTFPAGVTEIIVELADLTAGGESTYVFTTAAPGAQTVADGTLASNTDEYLISAVGCDYDAFSFAAPANTLQSPAILGPAGQDDITVAAPQDITPDTDTSTVRKSFRRGKFEHPTPYRRTLRT